MKRRNKSHWKNARLTGYNFEQGADGASNVSAPEVFYCDISYVLDLYKEPRTAPDGRLDIGELRSKEGNLPSFLFRWDEKAKQLDVDIRGVPNNIVKSFKRGQRGYKGHHPKRRESENTTFEVDIRIPDKQLFHGCIQFNINHMAKSALSIGLAVSASYKFTKRNEVNS